MSDAEREYLDRLHGADANIPPGTLIEVTEKNCDVQVGTRAYVVGGPLSKYDWPVYSVAWLDDAVAEDLDGHHLAGAFFKVVHPPIEITSITDVEKFLNGDE
jgi:hypothetical protein